MANFNEIKTFILFELKQMWSDSLDSTKAVKRPKVLSTVFFWVFVAYLLAFDITRDQEYRWKSILALFLAMVLATYKLWLQGDWRHTLKEEGGKRNA